ncbi:hypothetical protein C8Q79DRAFT_922050 [Trametes meyenii]|nr:hypothetical protein C8Q79DRAFT_922050 [Trametes meyenii]
MCNIQLIEAAQMPPARSQNKTSRRAKTTVACEVCGKSIGTQGYTQHLRKCERERHIELENREFVQGRATQQQSPPEPVAVRRTSKTSQCKRPAYLDVGADSDLEGDENMNVPPPTPQGHPDDRQPSPPGEAVADSSGTSGGSDGRSTTVHPIEEFTRVHDSQYKPPPQETPWSPFTTKADFEFAELSLEAALNKRQVDAFLRLIERLVQSEDRLTFRNQTDIETAWEGAAHKLTPFKKHVITVDYKTPRNHDVYCRDLWEWVVDLLSNAYLVSRMDFNAMKLSRFNGKEWIACYDEPATARIFGEIQC